MSTARDHSTPEPRSGDPDVMLLGFARALRAAGVGADQHRTHTLIEAVAELDVSRPRDVYWAGRLALCSTAEDVARYDACFAYYFSTEPLPRPTTETVAVPQVRPAMWQPESAPGQQEESDPDEATAASDAEVLRNRDIAQLSVPERAEVQRLLSLIAARRPKRRTRRLTPATRGQLDLGRTLRGVARLDGEPVRLHYRNRTDKPRRVVLIVDVSGSMSPYADSLLRLAHAVERGHPDHTEVFSAGTRLTRLTAELSRRDPDAALAAAGAAIPDWNGGTRLGSELKEFLDRFGQRGMARGALVVIASDGWERGDASLLGRQMARLHRLAHRVVWANPHRGKAGYEPLTAGMQAALPHIDDFVAGHSLAALEELAYAIIGGRGGAPSQPRRRPLAG
ncbi:vWA domain-containing protein [Spiractinospora alimapuensis]|uniref:vWA domain-containing protein n=1 Tax=Spiractinospora alimapuensis TaxID=2820884 RepID=UPI001F2C9753|nr:VWA domain-containing protein [Spiractinospora alimapuensis]